MAMRTPRNTLQVTVDRPPSSSASFSPECYEFCESRSSASENTQLLAADEEIENSDYAEELEPLLGAAKQPLWHYKRSSEMCAPLASLESMGMCQLDNEHLRFDLSRNYTSPIDDVSPPSVTEEGLDSPSRIESFDSLSDLAGNSNTFSRNGSSNSIGPAAAANSHPPLLSSSLPQHPSHHHRSPIHHICGSTDSGYSYDNSIDISSITDSSHTGMNDSLYTGPRFSIGLNASKYCNPEDSNIFMKPSNEFSGESETPMQSGDPMKLVSHVHIEADENLRDELERTAMKRQESEVSCVSTTARPPTTHGSDTLDSNSTPIAVSEGSGGQDTRTRKRSGAFSFHSRSSRTSDDYSTLESRADSQKVASLEGEAAQPRSAVEVKRLVKQRKQQVAGDQRNEDVEDEVFSQFSKSPQDKPNSNGHWSSPPQLHDTKVCPTGVSPPPCLPEVRVSCSPPALSSSWNGGESDCDLPANLTPACPVSGTCTCMCIMCSSLCSPLIVCTFLYI